MADELSDEDKAELQRQADDPASPINRDPLDRANKMVRDHVASFQTRQWCVERACTLVANRGDVNYMVGDTLSLARGLYAFLTEKA
jgi:hypothetical protein